MLGHWLDMLGFPPGGDCHRASVAGAEARGSEGLKVDSCFFFFFHVLRAQVHWREEINQDLNRLDEGLGLSRLKRNVSPMNNCNLGLDSGLSSKVVFVAFKSKFMRVGRKKELGVLGKGSRVAWAFWTPQPRFKPILKWRVKSQVGACGNSGTSMDTSVGGANADPSCFHADGSLRSPLMGSEVANKQVSDKGKGLLVDDGGKLVANGALASPEVDDDTVGPLYSLLDMLPQASISSPYLDQVDDYIVKPNRFPRPLGIVSAIFQV